MNARSGLSLWIVVLLMLFAGGIVGGGVYGYMRFLQPQVTVDSTAQTTASALADVTSLEVTELKVKLTLPAGLGDLLYIADTSHNNYVDATFSTRSLMTSAYKANGTNPNKLWCTPGDIPFGSIRRESKTAAPKSGYVGGSIVKDLGADNLVYFTPQSACSSDKVSTDLQNKQLQLFKQAVLSVEPL